MATHDPLRTAIEIREQIASEKRKLSFFFGAGTSMAIGLPGIDELTNRVSDLLEDPFKKQFKDIKESRAKKANVENILDRIRTIRDLVDDDEQAEYDGLKGGAAVTKLDSAICKIICNIMCGAPTNEMTPHLIFAHWIRSLYSNRYSPIEIFTTNYDLILEKAMEQLGVPYFDGFIGSVAPFFAPESVDAEEGRVNQSAYPPRMWTRLWKLHGSINWLLCNIGGKKRLTRLSGHEPKVGDELMVFPSRDKYSESRKLPFITFQDRFRRFLFTGESLLIVCGYSFSDDHINEIIFQGLRSNPRLSVISLIFGEKNNKSDSPPLIVQDKVIQYAEEYRNFTVLGPDKASIGGLSGSWELSRKRKDDEDWPFWDDVSKVFTLGDFNRFASYLEIFIGLKDVPRTSQPTASHSEET
jgi:hypothetical protein